MNEELQGEPFLKAIGFDVKTHLENVLSIIDGRHMKDFNSQDVFLTSTKYQGIKYQGIDDDPIKIPECISAVFGEDSPKEMEK